jgi:hypothetical protein
MKLRTTLILPAALLFAFFAIQTAPAQTTAPQAPESLPPAPLPEPPAPATIRVTPSPPAEPPAPPAPPAPSPILINGFAAYERCTFPDRLDLVERTLLSPGVTSRRVETSHGPMTIQLEAAERILFAYPQQDVFASVKVEKLPGPTYRAEKQNLIEDFNHTLANSPQGSRNYRLPARKRGFEIAGLDRNQLSGSVLGIYLFFDGLNGIATTIEFLNQDPATRNFQTIEEYARLRDRFLDTYTACIRTNQGVPVTP